MLHQTTGLPCLFKTLFQRSAGAILPSVLANIHPSTNITKADYVVIIALVFVGACCTCFSSVQQFVHVGNILLDDKTLSGILKLWKALYKGKPYFFSIHPPFTLSFFSCYSWDRKLLCCCPLLFWPFVSPLLWNDWFTAVSHRCLIDQLNTYHGPA